MATVPHVYHERQARSLCAVHALNNLFQQANAFTKESLDQICNTLDPDSWINGHKSVWGVGDYDINVLDTAIQTRGYQTRWLDRRMDPIELDFNNIFGLVLNVPTKKGFKWLPMLTSQRHWLAVRNLPSAAEVQEGLSHFYNLDSFLDHPVTIGQEVQLINFMRHCMQNLDKHLLLVLTLEVAANGSWRLPLPPAITTQEAC